MSDTGVNLARSAGSIQKPDFFRNVIAGEENEIKNLEEEQNKDPGSAEKTINGGGNSKPETVKVANPKKDNSEKIASKKAIISEAQENYGDALKQVSKMRVSDKAKEKEKEKQINSTA